MTGLLLLFPFVVALTIILAGDGLGMHSWEVWIDSSASMVSVLVSGAVAVVLTLVSVKQAFSR